MYWLWLKLYCNINSFPSWWGHSPVRLTEQLLSSFLAMGQTFFVWAQRLLVAQESLLSHYLTKFLLCLGWNAEFPKSSTTLHILLSNLSIFWPLPIVDWMNSSTQNIEMEDSNFDFRYVRLYDLDIPREKLLQYLKTVKTLIRCHILQHLIWVCTVYSFRGVQTTIVYGKIEKIFF